MQKRIRNRLAIGDCDKYELLGGLLREEGSEDFELVFDENGRPLVKGAGIFVSVSDCVFDGGTLSAAVVADEPVGVDVQVATERPRVARKFFSERERELPFALVWARKEAYAKYLGTGLTRKVLAMDTCAMGECFEEHEVDGGYVVVCGG